MTDNEIKKALECLMHDNCDDCPYYHRDDCADRIKDPTELSKYVLDLINRLQAENERLKADCDKIAEDYSNLMIEKDELFDEAENLIKSAKAEAIKEFAERLKEKGIKVQGGSGFEGVTTMTTNVQIDNLVKEMGVKSDEK